MGKGENASIQHYPTMFSKGFLLRIFGKGLKTMNMGASKIFQQEDHDGPKALT